MNVFIECFLLMFPMFFTSMFSLIAREKIKGNEISISSFSPNWRKFFTLFLCENFALLGRREEFSCSLAHIDLNSFPTSIKNSMIKSTLETIYSRKVISERKKLNCDKKMKKFSKKSFSPQIWKLSKFIFRSTLSCVKINFIPHNFLLKINYEAAGKKNLSHHLSMVREAHSIHLKKSVIKPIFHNNW